jgi:predicted component of type VI protein secretion system
VIVAEPRTPTLLADAVAATAAHAPDDAKPEADRLRRFLDEKDSAAAIRQWFGGAFTGSAEELSRRLNRDVAAIDRLLNAQLNEVLHAPAFQRLEASWRGLAYLVDRVEYEDDAVIKVRLLNATWKEVERDFEKAIEFDQSQIFKKVYENEFGMAGGEPFGALIADYEVHPRVTTSRGSSSGWTTNAPLTASNTRSGRACGRSKMRGSSASRCRGC